MAREITFTKLGGKAPFADGGLKLSKSILIDKIEPHEDFKSLFKIGDELLERITNSIRENSFDASQPLHIWAKAEDDGTVHNYLIDGYTRLEAARNAGLDTVPYFEHKFETFDEAYKYALSLQVNRRNLEGGELLRNVSRLLGTDFIQNAEGKKSEAIAEVLGVSPRTVEEAISVARNADEETLAEIDSGEKSVHKAYKETKKKREKREVAPDEDDGDDFNDATWKDDDDDFGDISDALGDSEGNPRQVHVHSRDMTERLSPPEQSDIDARLIERFKDGFVKGFKSGFSEGAYQAYDRMLSMLKDGKSAAEIEDSEMFSDFTFTVAAPKFEVPVGDGDILKEFNK